jgi:hypothetical protein
VERGRGGEGERGRGGEVERWNEVAVCSVVSVGIVVSGVSAVDTVKDGEAFRFLSVYTHVSRVCYESNTCQ